MVTEKPQDAVSEPASTDGEAAEPAEKPAEKPPEKPQADERNAAAQVALARHRRDLRKQAEAVKAAEAELAEFRALKAQVKTDRLGALATLGLTVDDVVSSAQPEDETAKLRKQVEDLTAETKAEREVRLQSEREALVAQGIAHIAKAVEQQADEYPLTHELGKADEVFDLMARRHADGESMTVAEAAAEIEKYLEDEEKAVERARQRRAKKAGKGAAVEPQSSEPDRAQQTAQAPAITSRMNGEAAQGAPKPFDLERYRREVLEAAVRGDLH